MHSADITYKYFVLSGSLTLESTNKPAEGIESRDMYLRGISHVNCVNYRLAAMPLLYNSLVAGLQSPPYPPATQSPLITIEPTGSRNTGYIEIGTDVKVEGQRKPWRRAESTNAGCFSLRILILHPHLFACPRRVFTYSFFSLIGW